MTIVTDQRIGKTSAQRALVGSPHSPEIEVLLACARGRMTREACSRISSVLGPDLDWTLLLQQAHRHSVMPLVRQNLLSHFRAEVPDSVRQSLGTACRFSQQRSLALTAELIHVLELLKSVGVVAIPFKGPALAMAAYGSTALRSFADLDILVRESAVSESRTLLSANGYLPSFTLTRTEDKAYLKEECAIQFRHPGRNIVIELHWRLTERYLSIDLPTEFLLNNCHTTTLAGRPILSFSLEDLLLYLCIHAGKHKWERLEWLSSIAAVIESNPDLPWPALAKRALSCGVDRIVKVTLLLTNELLHTPLPAPYRSAACDRAARTIANEVISTLFVVRDSVLRDRGNWYFFLVRSRERWSDKARIIAFSALRIPYPEAGRAAVLPPQWAFLHYALRPARLLHSAVLLGWRRWTSGRKRRATNSGLPASAMRPSQPPSHAKVLP